MLFLYPNLNYLFLITINFAIHFNFIIIFVEIRRFQMEYQCIKYSFFIEFKKYLYII